MDLLQRAFHEALDRNTAEVIRWTQYRELHEGARRNLKEFQKSLEIEIMVPIGTKALIPGRLYHTNEILVSHSGTYYSKCSAHKALEVCQHRLDIAAKRLEDLNAEAEMYRNKLELPINNDAFSSNDAEEIIEPYDEEVEKRWRDEHKKKMKQHKQKEAEERGKLLHAHVKDDIIEKLDELELMEELENELEAMQLVSFDDNSLRAFFDNNEHSSSTKTRISHLNDKNSQIQELPSSSDGPSRDGSSHEIESLATIDDNDDIDSDSDYDDVPIEFREIELKAQELTKPEQIKFYKTKLAEVQEYLQKFRPTNMEEISVKTDKIFFSDHLLNVIETLEDELNCDQYLNGENMIESEKSSTTKATTTLTPKTSTKPILKKRGSKNDQQRRISFALEDEIKSFDRSEEPSKISTTIQFEHGPVLKININHSEKKFTETHDDSDVIRNPADIYKHFAECKLIQKNEGDKPIKPKVKDASRIEKKQPSCRTSDQIPVSKQAQEADADIIEAKEEVKKKQPSCRTSDQIPVSKQAQEADANIIEAKEEVKEMLNNMFGAKNANEPDPLPQGNFVDSHAPKKRISLFKSSRMMKNK